ncbi:longitudinals lacking protein, isoforms H/M/V-like [Agrilus planipennis]|uniref:Longitudinals lacking protein, isoforms H/M/V-like n=1 Tax=Agrilus planipennis TaxID=224129 RepID=A0A1W4XCT6_AGRPL|nr:longitudinals lacking protein, isoforms H/M/V-like [Agrilus planipennis]
MEQFCLKWNNFQNSIISAFESLQNTEDLVDVTLTCEGVSIKAHKIILSACSPYFRTVFKENPCSHPIVILKDVHYIDLLAILNFMYHGEVLVSQSQLQSFLQTAELLQVSGLIGVSENRSKYIADLSNASAKPHKKTKVVTSPDRLTKKAKLLSKHKLTKSLTNSPPAKLCGQFEKSKSPNENFEVVQVESIKAEIDDDSKSGSLDYNENIENEKNSQGSILEAALECKDSHPSILERSLMSLPAKSSTSFPMEPIVTLAQPLESPIMPRKTSEQMDLDHHVFKQKLDSPSTATAKAYDLIIENLPKSIKSENDGGISIEQSPENSQGAHEFSSLMARSLSETIHHSSQCGNCPHCGKIYSNQSALKYHVRLVHSDLTNMYCCHLCPESFDYREGYKKHMVEVHSIRN